MLPGEALRFKSITQDQAERLWLESEKRLAEACAAAAEALT